MHTMPDVMTWLRRGVPLTLGLDLLDAAGPDSARILREERTPADSLAWLNGMVAEMSARNG